MWISVYDVTIVYYLFLACILIRQTESSCNEEQADQCRKAVADDKLDKLATGGRCESRQYVSFTHTCTLNQFHGRRTDHCCCVHERTVQCCRYHQSGDLFRCTQSEDTIEELPPETPPLEILLPAILVPLAILLCCVFCIIKCCCYNYDAEDNEYCDIPCLRKKEDPELNCDSKKGYTGRAPSRQTSYDDESRPLNRNSSLSSSTEPNMRGGLSSQCSLNGASSRGLFHPASTASQFSHDSAISTNSETKLIRMESIDEYEPLASQSACAPSAPPVEECAEKEDPFSSSSAFNNNDFTANPEHSLCRQHSNVSTTGSVNIPPYQAHAAPLPQRSNSVATSAPITGPVSVENMPRCTCPQHDAPACPPPTYGEHFRDPVI